MARKQTADVPRNEATGLVHAPLCTEEAETFRALKLSETESSEREPRAPRQGKHNITRTHTHTHTHTEPERESERARAREPERERERLTK